MLFRSGQKGEKGLEKGKIEMAINIYKEKMHLSDEEIIKLLISDLGITREEEKENLKKY